MALLAIQTTIEATIQTETQSTIQTETQSTAQPTSSILKPTIFIERDGCIHVSNGDGTTTDLQ